MEQFKNKENEMSKALTFLGNKLVDYKNIRLKNFSFNSEATHALLDNPNQGPVALASGDINNTGQIKIKLDDEYQFKIKGKFDTVGN